MRPRVNGLHAKRPEPPPATMILEIEVGKVLPQRALTNRPRRPAAKASAGPNMLAKSRSGYELHPQPKVQRPSTGRARRTPDLI